MMSSTLVTASTPYYATDHRNVLKSLQSENYMHNNNNSFINKYKSLKNPTIEQIFSPTSNTSTRTYVLRRPRTKIPHPLATLWSNPKSYNFKRSSSLRMRGTKSNLPFIMEPTINEIPLMNATTANGNNGKIDETLVNAEGEMVKKCTTSNRKTGTHETTTTAGGLISTRRKLALNNSQTESDAVDGYIATATTQKTGILKRPLSFRRANKISNNNNNNNNSNSNTSNSSITDKNKTDFPKDKICSAKIMLKSPTQHDTVKAKDQGDGLKTSTAATTNTGHESKSSNADFVKEFNKMSLNHNGVTTQNETTGSATTTTTNPQQTRPLTLNTNNPTALAATTINIGSKSPKTPHNTTTNHTQTTPTVGQQQQQQQQQKQQNHHHKHSSHSTLNKPLSPGAKLTPKTPPVTPDSPTTYLDDDLDSLFSYGTTTSGRSTMSCEHPYVARNGTTFSGRKMKYVVHCSSYAGQVGADYLTPTQRAQRQLRRLKELLCAARHDLEQKDSEILRLTREVVELRLFKASLSSPEERSASSDAVTVREAELKTSQDVSPIVDMVDDAQKTSSPRHHHHHHHHVHTPSAMLHQQHLPQSSLHQQQHNMLHHHLSSDMQSSFADSGHFEDMTSSSVHSKDSSYTPSLHTHDQACGSDEASLSPNNPASAATVEQYELQRQELIRLYEQRIEDLIRNQDTATSEMKRTNCDRIEALLQKLAECNTRYADIVPDYEHAKERIRELEKQLEELQRRLAEHEEKQKQMYLHMYQKGQEAERIARADQALELAHRAPQNKVSINELLHQLQSTQDELENIRAAECRNECGNNHALLTAKEAISLWVLGARKTIYRRLLEAQKNRTHVDPEVTLQFLKSAVYYFLTDKENSQGHLQAIESILEFSEAEKQTINKARAAK